MKTYNSLKIIVLSMALCATTLTLSGCDSTGPSKVSQPSASAAPVKTGGTVVFRETDGGFYGILTDNGGQFEPKNLDPKFRNDGLHINFTGSLDTIHLGEHHWGNPIELANVNASN